MAPTTDYTIISAKTVEELQTAVKAAVATGWQVYGGLVYAPNGTNRPGTRDIYFYQALVKTTPLLSQINSTLSTVSSTVSAIKTSVASIDEKTPEQ